MNMSTTSEVWSVDPKTRHTVIDENGLIVATVNGQDEDNSDTELIAKAPEMLAALRAILFQVVQGKVLERDACIGQARAIINDLKDTSWGVRWTSS